MSSIQKRSNGKYRARYRDRSGKEHARHFQRKADARAWLDQVAADRANGIEVDPRGGKTLLRDVAESWLAEQTSWAISTREAVTSRITNHVLPHLGELPVDAIDARTVRRWKADRSNHLSSGTVRQLLTHLHSILESCVTDGMIRQNPCAQVDKPKAAGRQVIDVWTDTQVQALIAAVPARYRLAPTLAAVAGLRQGECFGLRLQDVPELTPDVTTLGDPELLVRNQIKVEEGRLTQGLPKGRDGGKARRVPVPAALVDAIRDHLNDWPPLPDGILIYGREQKPVNRNYFNKAIWHPALREVGIEPNRNTGMHQLRHYYASTQLAGGLSIRALADNLGHSDPGFTLRIYTHVMPKDGERSRAIAGAVLDELRTVRGPADQIPPQAAGSGGF